MQCQTGRNFNPAMNTEHSFRRENWLIMKGKSIPGKKNAQDNEIVQLRALAHDLSNSLEAIMQASYLLTQSKLDPDSKRWAQLIDA